MTAFTIPYGKDYAEFDLPEHYETVVLAPRPVPPADDVAALAARALADPLGGLPAILEGARSAAVAVGDKTRPIPHAALRPLLAWLEARGLPPEAITLLIATGTHTPMTQDEFSRVLPDDLLARYPVQSHNCDDTGALVELGETARGTPVAVNRAYLEADLRLVVGNIESHQFMGYSGGVKSAAIGLAGRTTINRNHAIMLDPAAGLATYDDNPMRQDVEEIGRMMRVDFALNTVLNAQKQIVHVLAGDPVGVVRTGIPLVREVFEVAVDAPLDVVITSPGGHPKDINLYQAQKALGHARRVLKDGGSAILVAACPEGTGNRKYERWVAGMESHAAVLARFDREEFVLGPHKAFQFARDAVALRHMVLVSEMHPARVARLLLTPAASVREALSLVLRDLPSGARIGILPAANATVPVLRRPVPLAT